MPKSARSEYYRFCEGKQFALAIAVGCDWKGKLSAVIYAIAIPLAFLSARLALLRYILVAITWLIDYRIEKALLP
ncbi:MAG: hypothetical protein WBG32_10910 [Nodosilinea sp.]